MYFCTIDRINYSRVACYVDLIFNYIPIMLSERQRISYIFSDIFYFSPMDLCCCTTTNDATRDFGLFPKKQESNSLVADDFAVSR